MEDKVASLKKKALTGEEYYSASDIPELINENTPSISTFRRRVSENMIHIVNIAESDEIAYKADDVEMFLRGKLNLKRGGSRNRKSIKRGNNASALVVDNTSRTNSEKALIRPLAKSDVGAVYSLQFDQLGFENAIQPTSMYKWVEENLPLFWVAQNPLHSRDIWAVLGVLPLDEELIIRFLRDEFTLQEIAISEVLSYKPGQNYACYVIAAADPVHQGALIQLMEYILSFWCDQFPTISIRMLYASSSLEVKSIEVEENALLYMLKMFSFSRRRDISLSKGVWELPLDEYNPVLSIKAFRKCIREKSMLVIDKPSLQMLTTDETVTSPFNAPLQYRPATTREDVAAMVKIGAEIFLPPNAVPSISNEYQTDIWYSWLLKNPEIFHVVTVGGEIIGYISMLPLQENIIDNVMKGAHPTTITSEDVLLFEPGKTLDVYVHIWGTTPRLSKTQKSYASAKMIKELRKTFADFARRGVDIRAIYTRSNKEDGVGISQHIGFEDLEVAGVTDAPNPDDRKHVFRAVTTNSSQLFFVQYRQALQEYQATRDMQQTGD